MKVLIVGAGSVGQVLGAHLQAGGVQVEFLVKPAYATFHDRHAMVLQQLSFLPYVATWLRLCQRVALIVSLTPPRLQLPQVRPHGAARLRGARQPGRGAQQCGGHGVHRRHSHLCLHRLARWCRVHPGTACSRGCVPLVLARCVAIPRPLPMFHLIPPTGMQARQPRWCCSPSG